MLTNRTREQLALRCTQVVSGKQCILTEMGLEKLNIALEKVFNCKPVNVTNVQINSLTAVDREVISNIRSRNKNKPASRSSLQRLFNGLENWLIQKYGQKYDVTLNIKKLTLTDRDYEECSSSQVTPSTSNRPSKADKTSSLTSLINALSTLNYTNQITPFKNWVRSNQTGAFLIQGIPKGGQGWLTNRLIKQHFSYAYEAGNKPILIKPKPSQNEIYIDEIWEKLGEKLGLKKPTPEKCRQEAFQRWRNGTLIISIYTDKIYQKENYFSEFIQKFWQPLEEEIRIWAEEEDIESYLLLFLIDSANNPSAPWESQTFYSNNLTNWHPQKLMVLPKINELGTQDELANWMKTNRSLLNCPENTKEPEKKLTTVSKTIWDKTKGIPEDVFEQICQRCGCHWSEIEAELKL